VLKQLLCQSFLDRQATLNVFEKPFSFVSNSYLKNALNHEVGFSLKRGHLRIIFA
jgi:hypothetical protein